MTNYKEILRLHAQGISQRSIALSCECSRNTVAKVVRKAQEAGLKWPLPAEITDKDLEKSLFPVQSGDPGRKYPNMEYIHKELLRSGVTLKLLWNEYCEECRRENEIPLMYSQYCLHYQKFADKKRPSMHITRKPGDQIEVDWAGTVMNVTDRVTGELIPAFVFVAALSYSQYAYVEAFYSQSRDCWIKAHVNLFQYFCGSARMLVPDNLKTGVEKPDWYSPSINRTYHEMAEHYGTAVVPARVRKPKDKPNAEGAVGIATTWIIAALRNEKFFSLEELNAAVRDKLEKYNSTPFQKKEGSRLSIFLAEEKPMLLPLPASPFELADWKTATVQFNYHIFVDKMHYSVPYEYIGQKVDVRFTANMIEVFYHGHRVCSHKRLYGREGQYSTTEAHMPESHQKYVRWSAETFIEWAEKIGPNTMVAVKAILASHKVEQQGFKACMGILKLADKHSVTRLEAACKRALSYTPSPSYKSIKYIIDSGQDKLQEENTVSQTSEDQESFGFTRGSSYYGR